MGGFGCRPGLVSLSHVTRWYSAGLYSRRPFGVGIDRCHSTVIPHLGPGFAFSRKLGSLHFREELYRSAEIAAPPSSRLFLYDAKMGSSADDNVVRGIARSFGMIVTRPDRDWSRRVFSAECRPRKTRLRPAATRCATSGWPENRRSSAACR
jgi:hypothetical protein